MRIFDFSRKFFYYSVIHRFSYVEERWLYTSYDQIQDALDGLQEFKSYKGSICAVMKS